MTMVYCSIDFILASMLTRKIKLNPLRLRNVLFGVKSDGSNMLAKDRLSYRHRSGIWVSDC